MDKSCWTCGYQRNSGHKTFLGVCTYFSTVGKQDKDIPPNVVDNGCKQWQAKAEREPDMAEERVEQETGDEPGAVE